jgi:hypothetical protein
MDPNELLDQLRAHIDAWNETTENDTADAEDLTAAAAEVVIAFNDLDQWLTSGGFLPAEWNRRNL